MKSEGIAMAVAFGVSLASNALFASGLVSNKSIGQISNENPTFVTPDGLTFSIWGVIYSLESLMVVMMSLNPSSLQELFTSTDTVMGMSLRWRLTVAFLLNAIWLPAYVSLESFYLSFVIIVAYLIALGTAYSSLNPLAHASVHQWITVGAGVSCNISWVVVATCANFFNVLGHNGIIDENGVEGSVMLALLAVFGVTTVSVVQGLLSLDPAWPAVGAWALAGIYRTQTYPNPDRFPLASQSRTLAAAAFYCSIALGIVSVLTLIRFALAKKATQGILIPNPIE